MKKNNTFLNTICPFKLTLKEVLIVAWFCISICLLSIADDSPIWAIILVLVNFSASAYCLKYVHIKDDEEDA